MSKQSAQDLYVEISQLLAVQTVTGQLDSRGMSVKLTTSQAENHDTNH